MGIEISLPKPKVDKEKREQQIRAILGDDNEKSDGILSKSLVFVYLHGPLSISKLKDLLQGYYQMEFDRIKVFRAIDRLSKLNVLGKITAGEVMCIPEGETEDVFEKIKKEHQNFLGRLVPQFRVRYNNMNYTWFSQEGEKYLEWSCKLNNFGFKDDGRKK